MENFEKKFNSVNNASVSTGNKKSTIVKVVIGIGTFIGGAALIYWAKKKFSNNPSPEVKENEVDENGFEEIKK